MCYAQLFLITYLVSIVSLFLYAMLISCVVAMSRLISSLRSYVNESNSLWLNDTYFDGLVILYITNTNSLSSCFRMTKDIFIIYCTGVLMAGEVAVVRT